MQNCIFSYTLTLKYMLNNLNYATLLINSTFPQKKQSAFKPINGFIDTRIIVLIQQAFLPTNSCNYF